MSRRYFGTDGIRGRVGQAPITPDFVLKLAYAAGKVLSRADVAPPHRDRPAVLIGKDTRISGYMIESALESGLSAAGVDTFLVCPMPTPGVAFLTRQPNGVNINEDCGATVPKALARDVIEHQADFGIAFDGDGDRLAMADRDGTLFDGDQLLYAMVKYRKAEGRLAGGVAGTLMTNFSLERRVGEIGGSFARARLG